MCDYTQREYSCGHFRWIASQWCPCYANTHKRCQPNVKNWEVRSTELCGECKPKEYPAWENLIRRPKQPTY
ncbi:hypothetical protein BT67DRAFT_388699 [Trichocladium antarcticum]|uniref:Uncharacterized protein n=1 Tax=Trichocladium antarcticum TaxID=1450529 RepID=A0AAN6UEL4_9PEZI|nr:hypothetical protein BT67DRAFT_388699 [Trichocladium antarcticum]